MEPVVAVLFVASVYFLPLIVAIARAHHNAFAIGVLNLLLGWTLLFWILSLVWACTSARRD